MKDAPAQYPLECCYGALCGPCAAYQLRKEALGGNLKNYKCCQGYFTLCCTEAGKVGEQSAPEFCLCVEVCCCLSCSVSATRFLVMDQYRIQSDPCDNRIIRFNNFMQILSCVLNLLAICIDELREAAFIIDMIANIVYCCTLGCMQAQHRAELDFRKSQGQAPTGARAPNAMEMDRGGGGGVGAMMQQEQASKGHPQQQQQQQQQQHIPVVEAQPIQRA